MFTVVTTKRQNHKPLPSSQGYTKIIGDKSLEAMVAEAWAEVTPVNIQGPPEGLGWKDRKDFFKEIGLKDSGGRRYLSKHKGMFEQCTRIIGGARKSFIRPKSLAGK